MKEAENKQIANNSQLVVSVMKTTECNQELVRVSVCILYFRYHVQVRLLWGGKYLYRDQKNEQMPPMERVNRRAPLQAEGTANGKPLAGV